MSSVFVGNIAWRCSEQQLGDYFSKYGAVNSVKIITDYETGRSKGYGYVEMADENGQEAAIKGMNGFEIEGRALRTDRARPRNRN